MIIEKIDSFPDEFYNAPDLPTKKVYLNLLAQSFKSLVNWPRNMGYSMGQYMEDHFEEFLENPNKIPLLKKYFSPIRK